MKRIIKIKGRTTKDKTERTRILLYLFFLQRLKTITSAPSLIELVLKPFPSKMLRVRNYNKTGHRKKKAIIINMHTLSNSWSWLLIRKPKAHTTTYGFWVHSTAIIWNRDCKNSVSHTLTIFFKRNQTNQSISIKHYSQTKKWNTLNH